MERGGVISKVDDPTPWCAGMVVVPKKSGAIRICVDLKKLNESVLREVHPLLRVDETSALLAGATVFSKLDANSGFWQIPLAKESRLLTTFITPFGRYCFNKLPFGITSAPELFQKRMKMILEGLSGIVCQMDDILIFGSSQEEHNSRLLAVLQRLKETNVTLNREKCEFSKKSVKFLGHLIDGQGSKQDICPREYQSPKLCFRFVKVPWYGKPARKIFTSSGRVKPTTSRAVKPKKVMVMGTSTRTSFFQS